MHIYFRLGYSIALLAQLRRQDQRPIKVMYDIACRMGPQLRASGVSMEGLEVAVPVFHGYSHGAGCQVSINPYL